MIQMPKNPKLILFCTVLILNLCWVNACTSENEAKEAENIATEDAYKREVLSFDVKNLIEEEIINIKYYENEFYVLCDKKIYILAFGLENLEITAQMDLPKKYGYLSIFDSEPWGKRLYENFYLADVDEHIMVHFEYKRNPRGLVEGLDPKDKEYERKVTRLPDDIKKVQTVRYDKNPTGPVYYKCLTENLKKEIYITNNATPARWFSIGDKLNDGDITGVASLNAEKIAYLSDNALYVLERKNDHSTDIFYDMLHANSYDEVLRSVDCRKLSPSLGEYDIDDIFYDGENNHIWYYMDKAIYHYSIDGGDIEKFCDMAEYIPKGYENDPCVDMYILPDTVIAVHSASKMVYVIDKTPYENKIDYSGMDSVRILIQNDNWVWNLENLLPLIEETYGMKAEITVYPFEAGTDKIAVKLLAGDDDFDIYCLLSYFLPYYAKNNACYDLSSTKEITDNFAYMFDGLKEICSSGGKLCGVPLFVNSGQNMWNCNTELAKKLGIDIETLSTKKMTWGEFYDFIVSAKTKAESLGIENFRAVSDFGLIIDLKIQDYMTNYLDYTNKKVENKTDDYARYLDIYIKMLDENLISDRLESEGGAKSALFDRMGYFDYNNCELQPFPQPLLAAGDAYVIDPFVMAANPNSKNIEAAIKYLELSISPPILKKRPYDYLLKDWDLYECNSHLDHETKDHKHEAKTNGHEVTAFMIRNGKRRYYNLDIFREMSSHIDALRNSEMTAKDFAQKLYEKSKMIIEE